MRIFNINNVLTCALLDNSCPDLSKQSDKQLHYALNLYPYCKNNSDLISIDSLKSTLKNLNVLCLQTPTERNQVNLAHCVKSKFVAITPKAILSQAKKKANAIASKMIKPPINYRSSKNKNYFIKTKKHLVEYQFNISNPASSFPIFLFYKHKSSDLLTQELAKLLNNYWDKLNVNPIKNLALTKAVYKNEDQSEIIITEMDNDPHLKSLGIVEDIFNEIERQFSVNILGIFLDPYFISKIDNKLIAENVVDKRYSRTVESPIDTVNQQKSYSFKKDTELQLLRSETCEQNIDITDLQGQSSDNSINFATDSNSIESNSDDIETLTPLEAEINNNLDSGVPFISEANIPNEVELDDNQQDEQSLLISIQSINDYFVPKEENLANWNHEAKEKINNLLLEYQKHLTKQYFFRSKEFTVSKQTITTDLLNGLEKSTFQEFSKQIADTNATTTLNRHRDASFIQKLGYFFKRHNETKGSQLLKNIVSKLNKNRSEINTLSV